MKKRITFDIDLVTYNKILEVKEKLPFNISVSSILNTIVKYQINNLQDINNLDKM